MTNDPCLPCADADECSRPAVRDCVIPSFLKGSMLKQLAAMPGDTSERHPRTHRKAETVKREKRSKVEFGESGCTINELREALDVLELDLGTQCAITFFPVSDRNKVPATQGKDGMAYIAAIAGYSEVDG